MNPAIVQGHGRYVDGANVIALFIEDDRGDLVDIEYLCQSCAYNDPASEGALPWPVYDWGSGTARCSQCFVAVNHSPSA